MLLSVLETMVFLFVKCLPSFLLHISIISNTRESIWNNCTSSNSRVVYMLVIALLILDY